MTDPIATYTFLPWLRQGISSSISGEDNLGTGSGPGERAAVQISLQVNTDPNFVSQNVQLVGPGDILGISSRAIIRSEPRPWVTDFEPNYLAFIEFYEEDFPWRFTPARAVRRDPSGNPSSDPRHTKLRPWIFLLVLEEGEFEELTGLSAPLHAIRVTGPLDLLFPPFDQSWAWAHVHVSKDITAAETNTTDQTVTALEDLLDVNPDHALSRLVCPRKLKPSTAYHAFVIPTFESGRLAGLSQSTAGIDALTPAWGAGQVEYPIYYRWFFRTGTRGDFEYLVRLLEPREVDERVGIRDMDMQAPNFGVAGMSTGPNDLPVMGLEGALRSPDAKPNPANWPPPNRAKYPTFLTDLEEVVNLQETLLHPAEPDARHPDPIISPPLYGRWHAIQDRLEVGQQGWVNELNQDPRLRVPAGFGTQVIQAGQEMYMKRAWQQLGDVLQANHKIRQAQVSIGAGVRVFTRYFEQLDPDQQIAITRQVHARVRDSNATVFQQVRESRLEPAAVQPVFRRVLRPRGAVLRKALPGQAGKPTDVLVRINEGRIEAAPPKEAPKQQISLTHLADKLENVQLREDDLTADVVRRIPPQSNFRFSLPGRELEVTVGDFPGRDSDEGENFRNALLDLHERLEVALPPSGPRPTLDVATISTSLANAVHPKFAVLQRLYANIFIPDEIKDQLPSETVTRIMAHPVFADPMYGPLRDISSELLIPNLNLIPNNTITLLETNSRFIEAYMVGLNHEMARELLWREYPTDQRGSYFRQFWDVSNIVNREPDKAPKVIEEELRDIKSLHEWTRTTALGTHQNRTMPTGSEPGEARLVLVIRGDLLKRYPTAVIFAQAAEWAPDPEDPSFQIRILKEGDPKTNIKDPIFKAEIEPDLHFLGFDLTASQAKGSPTPPTLGETGNPGWFFVIQERPGEPRFGLDIADSPPKPGDPLNDWNDLTWNHLGNPDEIPFINLSPEKIPAVNNPENKIQWGSNAADMAYILFQAPAMVAIHADNMLK